jgi:hypothetical protein
VTLRPSSAAPTTARFKINRVTVWVGAATAMFAAVALAIGVATPPRSGAFCTSSCIGYPYTAAAAFVPRDYIWMYPATLMVLGFVALMVCLRHDARPEHRVLVGIGAALAVVAAAALTIDYAIQLTVVQPSLLKGETQDLSLVSMYNPHGLFIALEDLGYLLMGVAFFFAGCAFTGGARLERALRWVLTLAALTIVVMCAALAITQGQDLDYRFEVCAIAVDWLVLIVVGVLLALLSRSARRAATFETKPSGGRP